MSENPSGDELLNLAHDGNLAALGRLLEQYRAYLTLLAQLQLGRRLQVKADAADVVQDTFLEAARSFPTFRGRTEGQLLAWLRQVLASKLGGVVRRYVAARRDVNREQGLVADLDTSSERLGGLIAPGSSPSHVASRREQAVVLADALTRLPDHYREVIVLHHVEGLTLAETAARMNRTPDAVDKIWVRALARLRGLLGEQP